jgi:1,4-dihydroxy-2-naphthoate octaprenyltransferase
MTSDLWPPRSLARAVCSYLTGQHLVWCFQHFSFSAFDLLISALLLLSTINHPRSLTPTLDFRL